MKKLSIVNLLALGVILLAPCARAVPVVVPAIDNPDVARVAQCTSAGTPYEKCKSTAYVHDKALAGITPLLQSAFDAWNALPPDGDGPRGGNKNWSLLPGGALPGGRFKVDPQFSAWAEIPSGGMQFGLTWDWDGDRDGFSWLQAIHSNYARSDINGDRPGDFGLVAPFYLLDTCGATLPVSHDSCAGSAPPGYPIQKDWSLSDVPGAPWPSSFLNAQSFIAQIDAAQRRITVFEGVAWGFRLAVPAPSPLALVLAGLLALLAVRRGHWQRRLFIRP